jgi:hypothetical protein
MISLLLCAVVLSVSCCLATCPVYDSGWNSVDVTSNQFLADCSFSSGTFYQNVTIVQTSGANPVTNVQFTYESGPTYTCPSSPCQSIHSVTCLDPPCAFSVYTTCLTSSCPYDYIQNQAYATPSPTASPSHSTPTRTPSVSPYHTEAPSKSSAAHKNSTGIMLSAFLVLMVSLHV